MENSRREFYQKGYRQAIKDVLELIATIGINKPVDEDDIEWLENRIEKMK